MRRGIEPLTPPIQQRVMLKYCILMTSSNDIKIASFLHGLKQAITNCLFEVRMLMHEHINTYSCHDMSFLYSIQEHSTNATLTRSSQASRHILYHHKKWFSNDSSSQGHEGSSDMSHRSQFGTHTFFSSSLYLLTLY